MKINNLSVHRRAIYRIIYANAIEAVAGVRSAAVLDEAGRRKVLEHMRACGAQFRPARDKAAERPVAPLEYDRKRREKRAAGAAS